MSAKHTPGPWMAAAKPSSIVGWPVVAPRAMGRSICNVTVHDEAQGNARLIAAAPDMLAALKHAAANMPHPDQMIDDAIAKAEGAA